MEKFEITSVTADEGKLLIVVELARATTLGALWDGAKDLKLPIFSPTFAEQTVRFFSDREGEGEWKRVLSHLVVQGFVRKYAFVSETVPLSVVGDRFARDNAALYKLMDLLTQNNIQVTFAVGSAFSMTLGIPFAKVRDALELVREHVKE